jgi:hypothetical protein
MKRKITNLITLEEEGFKPIDDYDATTINNNLDENIEVYYEED